MMAQGIPQNVERHLLSRMVGMNLNLVCDCVDRKRRFVRSRSAEKSRHSEPVREASIVVLSGLGHERIAPAVSSKSPGHPHTAPPAARSPRMPNSQRRAQCLVQRYCPIAYVGLGLSATTPASRHLREPLGIRPNCCRPTLTPISYPAPGAPVHHIFFALLLSWLFAVRLDVQRASNRWNAPPPPLSGVEKLGGIISNTLGIESSTEFRLESPLTVWTHAPAHCRTGSQRTSYPRRFRSSPSIITSCVHTDPSKFSFFSTLLRERY